MIPFTSDIGSHVLMPSLLSSGKQ
jgi:hypothetical protein